MCLVYVGSTSGPDTFVKNRERTSEVCSNSSVVQAANFDSVLAAKHDIVVASQGQAYQRNIYHEVEEADHCHSEFGGPSEDPVFVFGRPPNFFKYL